MRLSPDDIIFWHYGFIKLNATIMVTWGLMLLLTVGSTMITRNLSTGLQRSRWQNLLEIIVTAIEKQIEEVGLSHPHKYLSFLGTIFLCHPWLGWLATGGAGVLVAVTLAIAVLLTVYSLGVYLYRYRGLFGGASTPTGDGS